MNQLSSVCLTDFALLRRYYGTFKSILDRALRL